MIRNVLPAMVFFCLLPWGGAAQSATPAPATTSAVTAAPADVRVMSFNIWVGGEQADLGQVVAANQASGADVVGLQEVEGRTREIADALGWQCADERVQIVSRLPRLAPPDAEGRYTFVQVRPGAAFAMGNVHLPSDPCGPDAVRDGETAEVVLQLEAETRVPMLQPVLNHLPALAEAGVSQLHRPRG